MTDTDMQSNLGDSKYQTSLTVDVVVSSKNLRSMIHKNRAVCHFERHNWCPILLLLEIHRKRVNALFK